MRKDRFARLYLDVLPSRYAAFRVRRRFAGAPAERAPTERLACHALELGRHLHWL